MFGSRKFRNVFTKYNNKKLMCVTNNVCFIMSALGIMN